MVFTYFCLVTVNRVFLHFLLGFRLGYICLSLPCHQISIKNLNNAGNTESFVPIVFFIPFIKYILSKIPLTNFAPRSKFSIQDILYQQSFFLPQNTKIPSLLINLPTSRWLAQEIRFETIGYRCSKTALNMLILDWSHKLKADGVKVWGVGPGMLETDLGG